MKKVLFIFTMLFATGLSAQAQKFALIDMEYILEQIPAYKQATEQLDASSRQWQAEVEKLGKEAKELYKSYQSQVSTLSDSQRAKREEAIIAKEKEAADLRQTYFGPEGEMYKLQESLLQPIQDQIYNAVKEIATRQGYAAVIDRASATSIIFASPGIDISDTVLSRLGY